MKNLKAFTLAEVLITLGVIGVVAAMTLPTLIKEYQKHVWVNQLKKSYSTISQTFQKILADEGTDDLRNISNLDDEYFSKYLNGSSGKRKNNVNYLNLDYGDEIKGEPIINLNDGTQLQVDFYDPVGNDCGHIYIDINGESKPNMIGRDYYSAQLLCNGSLKINNNITKEQCVNSPGDRCFDYLVSNGWKMDY